MQTANLWLTPHKKLDGITLMDHLFNRLDGMYPNRWQANFKNDNSIQNWKDAWAEAFDDDGITTQDVASGVKNCRRMFDWPPSLSEFLKACRPYLEYESAFQSAVAGMQKRRGGELGVWAHPAIYWAAVEVGAHDMLSQSWQTLKTRWTAAFDVQLSKQSWPAVPDSVPALPAPGQSVTSNAQAAKAAKEIAEKITARDSDPKAWARKILDNPKGRTVTVIAMAQRALGEVAA